MEEKIKDVYEAAKEGSVVSLLALLQRDDLILERCIATSFGDTPLHIAALLGHVDFCAELLKRRPRFARELDSRRSCGLHLASAKGHVEIVRSLLYADPDMCHARDCDDYNPVHVAAMKGELEVLKEMVRIRADAALARTDRGETVLHLCVQYCQLEALKQLIHDLGDDDELLNAADGEGNTILHIAVAEKQIKMVRHLIGNTAIDVNAYNSKGLTALDILACTRRDAKYNDIADCFRQAQPQESVEISSPQTKLRSSSTTILDQNKKKKSKKKNQVTTQQSELLYRKRESIMIVASVIATMAFQAVVNPPGGVWQEDKEDNEGKQHQLAGSSIFGDKDPLGHKIFAIVNTVSFISSLSIILILISGLPIENRTVFWIFMPIMWFSVTAIGGTYVISLLVTSPSTDFKLHVDIAAWIIIIWLALVVLMVVVHLVRLLYIAIRRVFRWMRTRRSPPAPANSNITATV